MPTGLDHAANNFPGGAIFLTRPKTLDFGLVPEAMDTYMVQFSGFWHLQRGQKWAFLASLKRRHSFTACGGIELLRMAGQFVARVNTQVDAGSSLFRYR